MGAGLFAASFYVGRSAREGSDPAEAAPGSGATPAEGTAAGPGTPTPTPKFIERDIERLQATADADYYTSFTKSTPQTNGSLAEDTTYSWDDTYRWLHQWEW